MLRPLDPHGKPNQAASTGMRHEDGSGSGGRERLKKLRLEVAGQVRIPDAWGEEGRLKDWADCSAFGRSFVPVGVVSARKALIEEFLQRASEAG